MPTKPTLYDVAMKASQQRRADSKRRMAEGLDQVVNWLDFTESLASPVGESGPKFGNGPNAGIMHNMSAAGIRNQMEGRGPSTGSIPEMMTWNWRDPIDKQRFTITTARGTKKNFKPFLRALAGTGYDIDSLGSMSYRNARGSNRLSEHAYGRAIDINPQQNPMSSSLVTNMPANIARLAALRGLVWGGTWKSKKDPMHFSTSGW